MDLFVSMEAFVRAAEAQSFASAARQLGVAKSVITVRVKQLEERFGVSLFHRSTRAVRLSEAGESYYRECVEIVNRIRDLAQRPGLADASPSGMLNVHVLPGFALGHFSDAVIRFRERYPRVEFTVVVNDRVIDPVQEGFDLALQIFPPASDALIERRLFPVRGMLCASPDYVECEPPLHTPSDLLNHDFARYSYYPWETNGRS